MVSLLRFQLGSDVRHDFPGELSWILRWELMGFVCIFGGTGSFLEMAPAVEMLLFMVMPTEVSVRIAVVERKFGRGVCCFSCKPTNGQGCSIPIWLPPAWFQMSNQLREFPRWESSNFGDYRVTFEFLLDCAKRSMGRFCRVICARRARHRSPLCRCPTVLGVAFIVGDRVLQYRQPVTCEFPIACGRS